MRREDRSLNVPATGQTGTALDVSEMTDMTVVVDGTGAGAFSCKVQMKLGNTWVDLDAGPITATKVIPVGVNSFKYAVSALRIVSTTTGAPAFTATVSGYNHRTH